MNETERTMEHDPGGAGATVDGMEGFDSAEGFDSTLEDILPNVMKRFCPECGEPVARNATGRPRKFCSTECCNAWWRKHAMTTGSYMQVEKDVSPTLMARDFKDPTSVAPVPQEVSYTVRRLTPSECARLQGFPDDWCHDLGTADPTEEEIAFWTDVFETYRKLVTHTKKPKTEKQIRKWLADPYSDAAEYKLWGNGVALPCVYFVLSGIVWASGLDTEK